MAIENINTRVYNTNLRWVERWNAVLEKLSGVLDMVEEELGGSGYGDDDREAVREKVESARDVLNDAQLAINEQAGKSYIVELDSELNLGEQVSGFVRSFKSDLKLVRDSVAEAREAVAEAVKALRSIS